MKFTAKQHRDLVIFSLEGRVFSMVDAEPLLVSVEEKLSLGKNLIILNLEKTDYINSEGLNMLLKILTKTRNAGGDCVLCNISGELENLFIITKLAHIFTIAKSVKASEEYLQNKFGSLAE